jgi:hypothetical protein
MFQTYVQFQKSEINVYTVMNCVLLTWMAGNMPLEEGTACVMIMWGQTYGKWELESFPRRRISLDAVTSTRFIALRGTTGGERQHPGEQL